MLSPSQPAISQLGAEIALISQLSWTIHYPPRILVLSSSSYKASYLVARFSSDLEKVVNRHQAENSEPYNVLKIAWFATNYEQKYVFGIIKSSNLDCFSSIHSSPYSILISINSILHPFTSNLFYPTKILPVQLFFFYPQKKEQDISLKKSTK